MSEERRPISFIMWILFNYLAWLIFWLFVEPLGAWLLYGRFYDVPFSRVLWQIWRGIGWLPMGLVMLAYNLFFPLSFYSWIFYLLLITGYAVYRLLWRKRENMETRERNRKRWSGRFRNGEKSIIREIVEEIRFTNVKWPRVKPPILEPFKIQHSLLLL